MVASHAEAVNKTSFDLTTWDWNDDGKFRLQSRQVIRQDCLGYSMK